MVYYTREAYELIEEEVCEEGPFAVLLGIGEIACESGLADYEDEENSMLVDAKGVNLTCRIISVEEV